MRGAAGVTLRAGYFVSFKAGAPMYLAGLYDVWRSGSEVEGGSAKRALDICSAAAVASDDGGAELPSSVLHSFTILTTSPSERLQWLHDRMPVILDAPAKVMQWLDCDGSAQSKSALTDLFVGCGARALVVSFDSVATLG